MYHDSKQITEENKKKYGGNLILSDGLNIKPTFISLPDLNDNYKLKPWNYFSIPLDKNPEGEKI